MTQHEHGNHHGHKNHGHPQKIAGKGLHKDWRAWTVVLLMLAAMAAYVLSDDESNVPGEAPSQVVPAAE